MCWMERSSVKDKFFDNLQSMKQAVLEYVNKHVSKQSKIRARSRAMKEDLRRRPLIRFVGSSTRKGAET